MISVKKLHNGGDKKVEEMIETSALLGVDLIELVWNKKRSDIAQVVGFKYPIIDGNNSSIDVGVSAAGWIDGTINFYPDKNDVCWGYIYDIPENRDLLYGSFSCNWFKIVDKKVRDEIAAEATAKGFATDPTEKTEIIIKKSTRELAAESNAKNLALKLEEEKQKIKRLEEQLKLATGEKTNYQERRLKGIKVPNRDDILEEKNAE